LTQQELLTLIQTRDLGNILVGGHDDRDLQDDFMGWGPVRRRRRTLDPNRFPKVPSGEGAKLMHSERFGANEFASETKVQKSLAMRLLRRELGLGDEEERKRIRSLIPQVGTATALYT
jgi:WD repeat-containing protein 23